VSKPATSRNHTIRGIAYVIIASFFFAAMGALIRLGAEELHAFQIAFLRNFFGLIFMLPWLYRDGMSALKTQRVGLYWLRAVFGVITMLTWFWAMTVMPLAEAVSLSFSAPLFVTLGAALILGEKVRGRRWTATLVGFAGVIIILRPGINAVSLPAIGVVCSALFMAGSVLLIKVLSRTESSNAIVLYMVLMMAPLSLLPAITVWQWPSAQTWLWMVMLGGFGTLAHLLFTNALKVAETSAVMPFDFVRLPFTVVLGIWLFDQYIDAWTWIGAIVIFSAGVYIAHREVLASREQASPVIVPRSLSDT
jgi:drug/metabolite transporter (DMT)-like permease